MADEDLSFAFDYLGRRQPLGGRTISALPSESGAGGVTGAPVTAPATPRTLSFGTSPDLGPPGSAIHGTAGEPSTLALLSRGLGFGARALDVSSSTPPSVAGLSPQDMAALDRRASVADELPDGDARPSGQDITGGPSDNVLGNAGGALGLAAGLVGAGQGFARGGAGGIAGGVGGLVSAGSSAASLAGGAEGIGRATGLGDSFMSTLSPAGSALDAAGDFLPYVGPALSIIGNLTNPPDKATHALHATETLLSAIPATAPLGLYLQLAEFLVGGERGPDTGRLQDEAERRQDLAGQSARQLGYNNAASALAGRVSSFSDLADVFNAARSLPVVTSPEGRMVANPGEPMWSVFGSLPWAKERDANDPSWLPLDTPLTEHMLQDPAFLNTFGPRLAATDTGRIYAQRLQELLQGAGNPYDTESWYPASAPIEAAPWSPE